MSVYGMINQAVRQLVVENHGETTWTAICTEAGLTETDFGSLQTYPDEITYKLVGACSTVLGLPAETVLEVFGEYWVEFAKQTSFGRLMRFAGRSLEEFVDNLDQMHAKIKMSLPELQPPSFRITESAPNSFRLHYYSARPGLTPLVKGMLKGVGKMFGIVVDIQLDRPRSEGSDHDEFTVTYAQVAVAAE
jgi:hypothetical protein